jgi:four helix bundle protein
MFSRELGYKLKAQSSKLEAQSSKLEAQSSKLKANQTKIIGISNRDEHPHVSGKERVEMDFGFENLDVWTRSVDFSVKVIELIESLDTPRKHYRLLEQIEASSTSIGMNLAEGKGRFSKKEFIQYCYIARGSLYETMTLLEIFRRKRWIADKDFDALKSEGLQIASMIKGLINSLYTSMNNK